MPKRSSNPPPPAEETGETTVPETPSAKNPAAVSLGRMGGLKGGKARAAALSKKKRSEIAQKAAAARWSKPKST